jgi:hypothetical protein
MATDLVERRRGGWLRATVRQRVAPAVRWLVPVAFIAVAVWGTNETMRELPRDYTVLDRRGARMTATFAGCTGGRDNTCRLRLPGERVLWDYRQNSAQFDGLSAGAPVEVLIDPENRRTRYTAVDVRRRTNAGFGVLFGFSIVIGLAGVASVPYLRRSGRPLPDIARAAEGHGAVGARSDVSPRVAVILALGRLDDVLFRASPLTGLTDHVVVRRDLLEEALDGLLEALPANVGTRPDVGMHRQLAGLVRGARPVPFTRRVLVDRRSVVDCIEALREETPRMVGGMPPARSAAVALLAALYDLDVLLSEKRGWSVHRAIVDEERLTAVMDRLRRAARPDFRRLDRERRLDRLERLVGEARPARRRGTVRLKGPDVFDAFVRLRQLADEYARRHD